MEAPQCGHSRPSAWGRKRHLSQAHQRILYVSTMFTAKLKTRTAMLYADARAKLSLAFFQNIQKSTTINTVRVAHLAQSPRPRNRTTKLRPRYMNGGTTAITSKSNS